MSILEMSEEEKKAIRKQHEDAVKLLNQKKADDKAGLQFKKPEKPTEPTEKKPIKKSK